MLLAIPDLLPADTIQALRTLSETGNMVSGGETAPNLAKNCIKDNLRLAEAQESRQQLSQLVLPTLFTNSVLGSTAYPKGIRDPILSIYKPGMKYKKHVDTAIDGSILGAPMRRDISMTIFLSPPESYDGGELIIYTGFGERRIQL
jgi:PKHD-type hydroxylase